MNDGCKIQSVDRKRQILDFQGMTGDGILKACTATDLDCVTEVRDSGWFLLEVKYNGKPIGEWDGQRRLMEAFMDDMMALGKPTLCVIADHYIDAPSQNVIVRDDCLVRELMWSATGKRWYKYAHTKTVGDIFDRYMDYMRGHLQEIREHVERRKRGINEHFAEVDRGVPGRGGLRLVV